MKATVAGVTTAFVGGYYEWTSNANTLYYSAGGARVAMRRSGYTSDNGLFWILGDHLGSTSIVANADGSLKSMLLYKAWGEVRYSTGVANTKYTFTGQYTHVPDFGLMFYVARWYDPALGRFAQADTMVPEQSQGVQAWDRMAYVNNSPVSHNDPTGHSCADLPGNSKKPCMVIMINMAVEDQQYQQAIYLAIDAYDIDVSAVNGSPRFNPYLPETIWGQTDENRNVEIGPDAFESPGRLGSAIGHETVHAQQSQEGRFYKKGQGVFMNEVEAYDWELAQEKNGSRFGLSESEISWIKFVRSLYYLELSQDNRDQVNNGFYTPVNP